MTTVIIDYGSGNLHSAAKAFERAGRESGLSTTIMVSARPEAVRGAQHIVLPGVGAFADCYHGLMRIPGMSEALSEAVIERARPFLGICVGMQLAARRGLEDGEWPGLGWFDGDVRRLEPADPALKVPHMGWNTLEPHSAHPVLEGIPMGPLGWHAYFVHSYHLVADQPDIVLAHTDYGGPVTAIAGRDNIIGTQFHPEKSQKLGLALIANFLAWRP
jgi:glutamine amidotransferase